MISDDESPYTKDGRSTAYLPLTFAWMYSSFLVPRARALGYALTIHGSMSRDLDLVAVPWTEEAVSPEELVSSLGEESDATAVSGPEIKPHGRLGWVLHLYHGYIDLSVMPRQETPIEGSTDASD